MPLNIILPTYTRGPGKSTGSFALESAIDELAWKLKMDPLNLEFKMNLVKIHLMGSHGHHELLSSV